MNKVELQSYLKKMLPGRRARIPGRMARLAAEDPLRAELLSIEQLKRFAKELAHRHEVDVGPGPNHLLPRLADNAGALRDAHQVLLDALAEGRRLSPPGEWMLDNFYLIEQQIHLARQHLPRTYSRRLPRLTRGPMKGLPRVYGMAYELISHLDGLLDSESTTAFVAAYQTVAPLRLGELWAFPIALRLGLIENLRRVAVRIASRRVEKDDGIRWAERTLTTAEEGPKHLIRRLAELAESHPDLSAPFLEEFVGRLQGHGSNVTFILNWIEQALAERATTVSQLLHADSHTQAAEHLSVVNSIGSLRFLGAKDWKSFVEALSHVEHILRRDPAGTYPHQDFATRDRFRHVVEHLALRTKRTETEIAQAALESASAVPSAAPDAARLRHIGTYLIGKERVAFQRSVGYPQSFPLLCGRLARRCRTVLYLSGILFISFAVSALLPWSQGVSPADPRFWLIVLVALLPASTLAISLVNFIVTLRVPPHPLPRLDFSDGIPPEHRTMVVVPTLIPEADLLAGMLGALEIRYLGNRDPQLYFALLTDFTDADQETLPADADLLRRLREGIEQLNARYPREDGTTFYLFHRPRVWNPHESLWMGYERKRGKLEQFNALLRGGPCEVFSEIVGDTSVLGSVQYVITLDTDTDLPRGSAHRMVGALAHTLNRPRVDPVLGRVVEGYAILQPRASVRLEAASRSMFTRLSCGEAGLDPYSQEVSDVYQDLFDEGSYVGKGIYHVDAFREVLEGRFPDNLILSHDLLESGYARSALLSCVEVYEDMPRSYLGDISRQHRWTRGDWQIARWILPRPPSGGRPRGRNRLSLLSRWKITDNLRRSLFAPVLLALLAVGWLTGPVPALLWTLFAFLVLCLTCILRTLTLLLRKPRERGWRLHLRTWAVGVLRHFAQPLLSLSVLPYEAVVALDAFRCSALKLPFKRRGLLIWHLDQYRRRNARSTPAGFFSEMAAAPLIAVAVATMVAVLRPASLPAALPLLVLWLLSPLVAWSISRPRLKASPSLSVAQWRMLRTLSRRTWEFFEVFTGAEDNWLPPDNFQEVPEPVVASRTSPTNMGFGLLASLTAWDFGYISTERLIERTHRTLDTMEKLARYRGHFYNWYDTRTLNTLHPQYVSSVDSGNLAGSLLALRNGLRELKDLPALSPQVWRGLQDTLCVLMDEAGTKVSPDFLEAVREAELLLVAPPSAAQDVVSRLNALRIAATRLKAAAAQEAYESAAEWASAFERQTVDHAEAAAALLSPVQGPVPTLGELARSKRVADEPEDSGRAIASALVLTLEQQAELCQELESAMDFRFLYNKQRDLLSIGFDVEARRLDPGCYDLLASESRIASFLLVATEQAPPDHWFALGRLLAGSEGSAALVSWSGSMFEYLMPALFMTHYEGTLLTQTCRAVIRRQIRYGRQRGIPWGISESCYNATDAHHVYQYRAFGVPGLGLKRGLSDDLVVAPYATVMSLPFLPVEACENIERLISREEALGKYGLLEAIDYTPARVPRGKHRAVVRTYMSHHQGMGFLALSHLLLGAPIVRRFMSDPAVRATETLLQERVPDVSPVIQPHVVEAAAGALPAEIEPGALMRVFPDPYRVTPEVHLLSNGNYHVMATHSGGGYSRWRDLALTRWREDTTCDNWGSFVYLRDVEQGKIWSTSFQPTRSVGDHYEAIFTQGRAEYRRRDLDVETHTEICVSPEDDVEIRRLTLTNQSRRKRRIDVASYAEVVMAPLASDLAHRVFSNLFVRTEILREKNAILCTRRKRAETDEQAWMFHVMVAPGRFIKPTFETDRARFLGRGRTTANPAALQVPAGEPVALSNTDGCVLDPVVAIHLGMLVTTDERSVVHVITGAAPTREAALVLIDKYRDHHFVERAFDMAWSHSQIVLRLLNVTEAETQLYGRLAGSMLYAHSRHRAAPSVLVRNRLGQQGLWRFGVSGDLPILLLRIADLRRMELVTEVLRAHSYWRMKGLPTDLVILNEDFSGYRATLNDRIIAAINAGPDAELLDKPGGVFVRRVENLSEEDLVLFQTVARVVITDSAETLREQVERRYVPRRLPPYLEPTASALHPKPEPLPPRERILDNGLGGFTPDGREYVIALEPGRTTPAPWVNVIASPFIGTVVGESGSSYTWVDNAHEFRLTPWMNDPVSDPTGEACYLRDEDTGAFWSVSPQPAPGNSGYVCRHGFGYSVFDHNEGGLVSEAWVYVAMDAPVKFVVVKVRNESGHSRKLSLAAFNELVLGEWRHSNAMHIRTDVDPQSGALFARNPYSREFCERVVFASCSEPEYTVSGSRAEFLGRNGSMAAPDALRRLRLSGRTGAGFDPAASLHAVFNLAAGQDREIVFTLGAAPNASEAQQMLRRFSGPEGARAALENVWGYWNRLLGAVYVEVPKATPFTILVNGWLLYQTLSCRIWGRSGFYQSGGAYGFRDQLQDAMSLLHVAPELLRSHLLLCASRQFREGDVQHWWHPPAGAGVRTHFSDDLLWLPQAVARYVLATGDSGVLEEQVPFLEGRLLAADEESLYDQHPHSSEKATLYEHCLRAIRHSLRFGEHGLPLIGCGDWNDGMNRIGKEGRGESVWLAWFICDTLRRFGDVAKLRQDGPTEEFCRREEEQLRVRTENSAWDGEWYRRAYFDDGTPLGSAENDECRIDSLSQSWAVLSGAAQPERARQAMHAVRDQLVLADEKMVLLFAPPFDKTPLDPGYIKGYPPGVRENGGQYTHGAIWTVMAFAQLGEHQTAWDLFQMLNPIHHGDSPEAIAKYRVEPYVMTADLYSAEPHTGRGGWSWYTGAAGWMYRLAMESLLGLERFPDHLRITPRMPVGAWKSFRLHYRFRENFYHIDIRSGKQGSGVSVALDGKDLSGDGRIPLIDDRRDHEAVVTWG